MSWNTLYSYDKGRIYLHLKNNDLLYLNFSISGQDQPKYNLENNQQLTTLTSPPINSTLFLYNDDLFALINDETSSEYDLCGNGEISIIKYDGDSNSWSSKIDLIFDDIIDGSYYSLPTILTNLANNETIYIYGGICQQDKKVSNRLLSVDLSTGKLNNITTSTKPQSFYGASNLNAPNPQTQLVIGGQSNSGSWLNMYQLATWDFNSGWSFKQIDNMSGETINSRKNSLILPIFKPFNQTVDGVASIMDELNIEEILMVGGENEQSELSSPIYSKLHMNSNNWIWNVTNGIDITYEQILGAATIFNTLVVVNSTESSVSKRDSITHYSINLYDTNTFKSVETLKDNTQLPTMSDSSNSSSSKTKIILGTVIPIVSILIIASLIVYLLLKKKKDRLRHENNQFNEEMEYKFNYLHPETDSNVNDQIYINVNDSNSTLSGTNNSINSWMKKRQDYDINKQRYRNSYLASNETLNMMVEDEQMQDVNLSQVNTPAPAIHKSIRNLKKSFSFSNTPPSSPLIKKKSQGKLQSLRLTNNEQLDQSFEYKSEEESLKDEDFKGKNYGDLASVDDNMDVQVLVSSKRRSILKVVNPDLESLNISRNDEFDEGNSSVYDDNESRFSRVIENHFERINDSYHQDDEINVNKHTMGSKHSETLRFRTPSGQYKGESEN